MITSLKQLATVSVLLTLIACSTNQVSPDNLMRGSVVRASENTIVVCLGSDEPIEPGAIFSVNRATYSGSIDADTDTYSRENVGKIRILRPLNDHFAKARIIDGEAKSGDMIEQASDLK
jgi:hypothetical protein